ncbi:MAG: hypothetical protein ACI89Z_000391 [Porticoccus sp.]|jgi:hypothetical protein
MLVTYGERPKKTTGIRENSFHVSGLLVRYRLNLMVVLNKVLLGNTGWT